MVGMIRRPFDWHRDCPGDTVARRFPAVVGKGRGRPLTDKAIAEARRKLHGRGLTPEEGAA